MAKTKFKQDKHEFMLVGKVRGVDQKNFLKTRITPKGKEERVLNFRVEFALGENGKEGSSEYVELKGYSGSAYVYDNLNKKTIQLGYDEYPKLLKEDSDRVKAERDTKKTDKEKMLIKNRYSLMSNVQIKLGKDEGVKNVTSFEGVKIVADFLKSNPDSVLRVAGDIEYSMYRKDGELKVAKKLSIKRIYSSDVDMTAEGYENVHGFSSGIIFTEAVAGTEPTIDGYTVIRDDIIVPVSLRATPKLVQDFKKAKVKPFTHMQFVGKIMADVEVESVTENDSQSYFGEEVSEYTKNYATAYNRYLLLVGANPNSMDTETYIEEEIEEMFSNQKLFGDDDKPSAFGEIQKSIASSTTASSFEDEDTDDYPF